MIGPAIKAILEADATFMTLAPDGVHPLFSIPQDSENAAITYDIDDEFREVTASGTSDLARIEVTLVAWAFSYKTAADIMAQVRRVIQDFKGSAGGVEIERILPGGGAADVFNEQVAKFGSAATYAVWVHDT